MNEKLKDFLTVLVLSIATSFMLFIFEPIILYSTNPNDFWFDIYDIFPILLSTFLKSLLVLFIGFMALYFIFKVWLKKPNIYYVLVAIYFCVFLITYIQGNLFSNTLPGINGEVFDWRHYKIESVTSMILWGTIFIIWLGTTYLFKPVKIYSAILPISSAIFAMLAVSLTSTILTTKALEDKPISVATYTNFNLASDKQNLFIFLLDAIDSQSFDKLMKNNKDYQSTFKDFSYFPDTSSYYAYTRDSLPYIFNPVPNHNEKGFADFSREVYANSPLFASLKSENYNMNYYDDKIFFDTPTTRSFSNMIDHINVNRTIFLKQLIKYDLYKYLPYPLKGKTHIEGLNFSTAKAKNEHPNYMWKDIENYEIFQNEELEITDDKVFHFIHLEGAHIWFYLDENVQAIETGGNYSKKQIASFKIAKAYIDRLKKANVYDNSAIVIMADHGYKDGVWEYDYILDRFNPILYIKGIDEHHDKMLRSDKPISFDDLSNAFIDLQHKKKSTELFKNISYPRTRTLLYYVWSQENHMVEYEFNGKAWESDKMVETGKVFDLNQ